MLSDKLTKPQIVCKPQIILEKYLLLGHLLQTSISSVSLFCEEQHFIQAKSMQLHVSVKDPRPQTQQQRPLCSDAL